MKKAPVLSDKRIRSELIVIDNRSNKKDLGNLRTGAFNRYAPVVPRKSIDALLASYYGNIHGSEKLLLILYDFNIEDRPNGQEIGTFHFSGDFFSGNNKEYRYLAKVDSIYETASAWDVSHAVMDIVENRISALLNWYGGNNAVPGNEMFTIQEASDKRSKDKMKYTIYQTTTFKKGIYYTVDQFLQHQPIDTPFMVKDVTYTEGGRSIYPYYLNAKGKKDKQIHGDSYFAIYDGKQWYTGNPNARMGYENGDFYTAKYFSGVTLGSQGFIVAGALTGGLIGVAITSSIIGTSTGKNRATAYKAKFDPDTKAFLPLKRQISSR